MVIPTYLFIILSNFYYSVRRKESKSIIILSGLVILLLMAGAGPNYSFWADYDNYVLSYHRSTSIGLLDEIEVGYLLLKKLGMFLGLEFYTFRAIIIGICLITIYKEVILRYTLNGHYVILLYMLHQMIVDSEQFRNFIALTILLVSIKYLLTKTKESNIKYVLMILLAASFHSSFILYIIFVFIKDKSKKVLITIVFFSVVLLTGFTIINNNEIPFLNIILNELTNDKIVSYLTSKINFGYLLPFFLQLFSIFLLFLSKRIIRERNNEVTTHNMRSYTDEIVRETNFIDLVYYMNLLAIIYIPLFILDINFYRLIRNLLILNYIVYSITAYKLKKRSTTLHFYNILVTFNLITWFLIELNIIIATERLLIPFFRENAFRLFF